MSFFYAKFDEFLFITYKHTRNHELVSQEPIKNEYRINTSIN